MIVRRDTTKGKNKKAGNRSQDEILGHAPDSIRHVCYHTRAKNIRAWPFSYTPRVLCPRFFAGADRTPAASRSRFGRGWSAAGIPRPPSGVVSRRAGNTRNPACRPNSVRPAPTYAVQPSHATNWRGNIGTDTNGVKLRLSVRCRGRARESSSVFPALLQP